MKLLFIVLFSTTLLISASKQDELQAVEATYDGLAEGIIYFVDIEGSSYIFHEMEPKAREKYDLNDKSYVGKKFRVLYRIVFNTVADKEDEYDYGECIIVDLEMVA